MEQTRPRLVLKTRWRTGIGGLRLTVNRVQFLAGAILLAELAAGALAGILIYEGPWWVKIWSLLLLAGFLLAGVRAFILIRQSELGEIISGLEGLAEDPERKRLYFDEPEDELGRVGLLLNRLLDQADARLEKQRRLIGAISHDLRTPLTILRGDMEVALLRERPVSEYQEILRSDLEEVDRISRLVEDLLTVSKAEAGDLKMVFRPADMSRILAELHADYAPSASDKGMDLTIDAENAIILELDEHRIKQLFANLIENAIKYSPAGGRVDLVLRRGEKEAWVLVRDQGIGIPPEELPYIFEPFYRGGEAKHLASKGYGLGLSICKQIANAHNGDIEVESRVGPESGTTFKVRFPL